jgi:predicted PurR-regulated permease PerM
VTEPDAPPETADTIDDPPPPASEDAHPAAEAAAAGVRRLIGAVPSFWGLTGPAAALVLVILAAVALLSGSAAVGLVLSVIQRGLGDLLPVLLVGGVIAYLLDPVIDRFEAVGWQRSTAIGLCLGLFLAVDAVLLLFLVPYVVNEVGALSENIDGYVLRLGEQMHATEGFLQRRVDPGINLGWGALSAEIPALLKKLPTGSLDPVKAAAQALVGQTFGVLGFLVRWSLLPVFAFFFLRDFDRIKRGVFDLVPHRWRAPVLRNGVEIDRKLANFVRGQGIVCVALAVLYAAGLGLFTGIDMALLVGVTAGLLFVIPYFGTFLGILVGSALALLKFGVSFEIVKVWLVFGVVQGIEGTLLTPKIVGDSVGLHPVLVMLALFAGGGLFGLLGVLLAVPAAAAAQVLIVGGVEWLRATPWFQEGAEDAPNPDHLP